MPVAANCGGIPGAKDAAGRNTSFWQMVVFGDSLSDMGNDAGWAWAQGFHTSNGRFTSDTTSSPPSAGTGVWHEALADH